MTRRACVFVLVALVLAVAAPARAQFDNVGTLDFPTSGSPEAQKHFLRAVAILHSFGWKQAIEEFKAAQKIHPDFAMAYWGETLCYNHPLQNEQDAENPRKVLARLGPTPAASGTWTRWKGCMRRIRRTRRWRPSTPSRS